MCDGESSVGASADVGVYGLSVYASYVCGFVADSSVMVSSGKSSEAVVYEASCDVEVFCKS